MNLSEEIIDSNTLRANLRKVSQNIRKSNKESKNDSMRLGLGEIQVIQTELEKLSPKDVNGLCVRIKRKKHASADDMFRLSYAFLLSEENIETFIKNTGAINVLVKELTGHESEVQVKACETICNLSLGNRVPCEKIALNAGSYLLMYLDSMDLRLKQTSLWVITNIAATGGKGLEVLISLELIQKLVHMWNKEKDQEILRDIVITLDLIVSSDRLRPADIITLRKYLLRKPANIAFGDCHLKIIFEHLIDTDVELTQDELLFLIQSCVDVLSETDDLSLKENILKIIFALRIISNLTSVNADAATILISIVSSINAFFPNILNRLFEKEAALDEVFWFVKNLLICQNIDMQKYLEENPILEELKVGRFSVPTFL